MTTYETLFITTPDLSEADEETLVDGLAKVVTGGGGTMVARERMGRRRLAYPIQKCDDGVYTVFLYEAEAAVPKELERRVGLSDKVIRWMTVKLEREAIQYAKDQAVKNAEARARAEAEAQARAEAEAKAKAEAEAKAEADAEAAKAKAEAEAEQPAAGEEAVEAKPAAGDDGADSGAEDSSSDTPQSE